MTFSDTPASNKCEAKLWRNVWIETFFWNCSFRTTSFMQPCTVVASMGRVVVDAACLFRPIAGNSNTGLRCVDQ